MAIDFTVKVAISRRKDAHLRFYSVDLKDRKRAALPGLRYRKEDRWANYPKGVIAALSARGCALGGMDITIRGDIPQGAGLSSSAALEIATALAIQELFRLDIGREELATLAREAESDFVGARAGFMDQLVSRLAREGHAMLIDTRLLTYHFVPLQLKGATFLVTNSRVPHVFADAEYNRRREECRGCVDVLSLKKPGTALRDYTPRTSATAWDPSPSPRGRSACTSWRRTRASWRPRMPCAKKDLVGFGKLMNRSHESLRDLYEVSCPELDWLVKRAWETEGVYGSRLTGAGFGGCTITLIDEKAVPRYREAHRAVRAHLRLPARGLRVQAVRRGEGAGAQGVDRMRVLITNDDGIGSEGLRALEKALSVDNEVWVAAPENREERGLAFHHAAGLHPRAEGGGEAVLLPGDPRRLRAGLPAGAGACRHRDRALRASTTAPTSAPTSCIRARPPGPARGRSWGSPRWRCRSIPTRPPFDFAGPGDFVARNLAIFRELWTDDHFLNINFPSSGLLRGGPRRSRSPRAASTATGWQTYTAPTGDLFCFLTGEFPDAHLEEGSDCQVVSAGNISISPVHAHPRNWVSIEDSYREARFR